MSPAGTEHVGFAQTDIWALRVIGVSLVGRAKLLESYDD